MKLPGGGREKRKSTGLHGFHKGHLQAGVLYPASFTGPWLGSAPGRPCAARTRPAAWGRGHQRGRHTGALVAHGGPRGPRQ